jgi:hypothetical protein
MSEANVPNRPRERSAQPKRQKKGFNSESNRKRGTRPTGRLRPAPAPGRAGRIEVGNKPSGSTRRRARPARPTGRAGDPRASRSSWPGEPEETAEFLPGCALAAAHMTDAPLGRGICPPDEPLPGHFWLAIKPDQGRPYTRPWLWFGSARPRSQVALSTAPRTPTVSYHTLCTAVTGDRTDRIFETPPGLPRFRSRAQPGPAVSVALERSRRLGVLGQFHRQCSQSKLHARRPCPETGHGFASDFTTPGTSVSLRERNPRLATTMPPRTTTAVRKAWSLIDQSAGPVFWPSKTASAVF